MASIPRPAREPIALYIHIPFCETKCNYCNFNTFARLDHLIPAYVDALVKEIQAWAKALDHPPVRTVFFGGGTPSWLPVEALERVLSAARVVFSLHPTCEMTAEANPGDVTPDKARCWLAMGINRLSIGVQSFDDALLRLLTRRHSAAQAAAAYHTAREAGFGNINLDLMYGLPGQTLDGWRATLERVLQLSPEHLSLYALTVEEGTPLWQDVQRGRIERPDPDRAADMYILAEGMLGAAGYRHYEISNWARPGRECRHNLVYWHNEPFLGVGPGAHSYLQGQRFWNIKSPADYIRRLSVPGPEPVEGRRGEAAIPVIEQRQLLTEAEVLSETLILALRLDEGVSARELVTRFGQTSVQSHLNALRQCIPLGLVEESDGRFRLTQRGRLLSSEVFVRLLPS